MLTTRTNDGKTMPYYHKNGLFVALTTSDVYDYGSFYRVDIYISNYSMRPVSFSPSRLTAFITNKKGKESRLNVLSVDEYMKKVNKGQIWDAVLHGLREADATQNAGYSRTQTVINSSTSGTINENGFASIFGSSGSIYGSYSGNSTFSGNTQTVITTEIYDAAAAYQAKMLSNQRTRAFGNALREQRRSKQQNYLKQSKINPGDAICGYINIEKKKGTKLDVYVFVEDILYEFPIDVTKL